MRQYYQIPYYFPPILRDEDSAGSPLFSSFRKNRRQSSFVKNSRTSSILSTFLEAEICVLLALMSNN
jgi:hypothetical protein